MKLGEILERERVVGRNPDLTGREPGSDSEHVPVALGRTHDSQRVILNEHAALIALSERLDVRVITIALLIVGVCVSYRNDAIKDHPNLSVVEDRVGIVDTAGSESRVVENNVIRQSCPAGLNEAKADLARCVARSVCTLVVNTPLNGKTLEKNLVSRPLANFVSNGIRDPHYRLDLVRSNTGAGRHDDCVLIIIGRNLLSHRSTDG